MNNLILLIVCFVADILLRKSKRMPVNMRFETRRQAMDEVIDWLTYYNHRRRH